MAGHALGWRIMDQKRELLSQFLRMSGSAVYRGENPVEAGLRDVHAICASLGTASAFVQVARCVRLGREPGLPTF